MVKKVTKAKKSTRRKSAPSPGAISMAEDRKFRAQSDLRTLRDANEIRKDSSRINAARKEADKAMAALKKIGGKG